MFKVPQIGRFLKMIAIFEAIIMFFILLIMPDFFIVFLIAGVLLLLGMIIFFKLFEWICFGSDD